MGIVSLFWLNTSSQQLHCYDIVKINGWHQALTYIGKIFDPILTCYKIIILFIQVLEETIWTSM